MSETIHHTRVVQPNGQYQDCFVGDELLSAYMANQLRRHDGSAFFVDAKCRGTGVLSAVECHRIEQELEQNPDVLAPR